MENKDIRWIQRFNNFNKTLKGLQKAIEESKKDPEDEVLKVGMIKFFEMTYELAWLTMKDYYEEQGEIGIQGSKDAIKLASSRGLIHQAQDWFNMVDSRKLSVHTYDEKTAQEVAKDIAETYVGLFIQLQTRLQLEKLSR
ncbi:nucleotidyltransferase substrate binding protein [Belliella kenyensis]|uniref:Nucleotidyltransferase substrate binding protein n=1 Tax=Belliella kenyensis TaxID=1472724 RepID=A0ABV8EJ29_9BACT|nr:nucleotidyltransferase substrate binding protein [Belliella kenyensis]MCH7401211.1 nucleotidyltransferase substrate binding protein [Belliella kenyensis]MDN3602657.1 nucleotidyltransferase substrate binding protein [Belliella kenyensis]